MSKYRCFNFVSKRSRYDQLNILISEEIFIYVVHSRMTKYFFLDSGRCEECIIGLVFYGMRNEIAIDKMKIFVQAHESLDKKNNN